MWKGPRHQKNFFFWGRLSDLDVALVNGIKISIFPFSNLENYYGSWIAFGMVFIIYIFSFPFVYFFWMFIFVWNILGRCFCHLYYKCRLLQGRASSEINVILSILNNKRNFLNIFCCLPWIFASSLSCFSYWSIFVVVYVRLMLLYDFLIFLKMLPISR